MTALPFDGAISAFYDDPANADLKDAIKDAGKNDIIDPTYPYRKRLDRDTYEDTLAALQLELAKLQAHVNKTGERIVV